MTTKNMNTPPGSTQENEIDLLRLVGELWDHRKFIISVTALFTLIAVAYSLLSTPIYQADTLVQVEQKQGNAILSGLSDMIPKEGANKRGNSSRLTQSFHFFMFEPIFSPVNALNQPI